MTPEHFLHILQAEVVKLFSRLTARVGLVVAGGLAVAGPLALWWIGNSEMVMNGARVAEKVDKIAPAGLLWSLELRNFFILRAFIIMLVAMSFASEYANRTVREDILRPVPRWAVPVAKWLAVASWILLSLVFAFILSSVLGVVVFGFEGDWLRPLAAYGATFLADVGFAALVLLVAIASRSVAGTIAGVFLYAVFDTVLGWMLKLLGVVADFIYRPSVPGGETGMPDFMKLALGAEPWLPSSAFGAWSGYRLEAAEGLASEMVTSWNWEGFVALAVITVLSMVGSVLVFRRLDVP